MLRRLSLCRLVIFLTLLSAFQSQIALSGVTFIPEIQTVASSSTYLLNIILKATMYAQSEIILNFSSSSITVPSSALPICRYINANANLNKDYSDCSCAAMLCKIKTNNQVNTGELFTLQLGNLVNPPFVDKQLVKLRINYNTLNDFSEFDITTSTYLPSAFINPVLTQGSYFVQDTTDYAISFGISTDVPAKAKLKIKFPPELEPSPASPAIAVTIYEQPEVAASYPSINDRLIVLDSLFNSAGLKFETSKKFTIKIASLRNPTAVFKSSQFAIEITTAQDQQISSLQANIFAESKTPKEIAVENANATSGSSFFVRSETAFNFKIRPALSFDAGSFLEITFPPSFTFNDATLACTVSFGLTSPSNTNLICVRSGNKVQTRNSIYDSGGKLIDINVLGVINPPTTETTTSFLFQTLDSQNRIICASTKAPTFKATPNPLTLLEDVLRTSDSFDTPVNISGKVQINTRIEKGAFFGVVVPEEQAVLIGSSASCLGAVGKSDYVSVSCTVDAKAAPSFPGSTILIKEWCANMDSYCLEKTSLAFKIFSTFKNPPSKAPNPTSLSVFTKTPSSMDYYEMLSSNIFISPALKTIDIPDLSISRIGSDTVGGLSDYEITFTPPEYFRLNKGKLQAFFPKNWANKALTQTTQCFYIGGAAQPDQKSCSIQMFDGSASSIYFIEITDTCVVACSPGLMKFKITNIRNALSEKPIPPLDESNFLGVKLLTPTYSLISFTLAKTFISQNIASILFNPSPKITLSDDTTGKISSYTVAFTPQIAVPASADGSIQLILPPEVTIDPEAKCSANAYFPDAAKSFRACAVSPLDRTVTARHDMDPSSLAGTQIRITVDKIKNPPSTSPTSKFSLRSYMEDKYLIERADLVLSISSPYLLSVSITRKSTDVAASTSLLVTLTLYNPIASGGRIKIAFPRDQIVFSSGPTINRQSPEGQLVPRSYKLIENTADYYVVSFDESQCPCAGQSVLAYNISGGSNPQTTKIPSNSFKVSSQTSEDYLIEAVSSQAFAKPYVSAGRLDVVSLSMTSKVTGTATVLNLQFSLTTPLEVNGKIMITFPNDLFFADSATPTCAKIKPETSNVLCSFILKSGSKYGEYIESIKLENYCKTQACAAAIANEISVAGMKTAPFISDVNNTVTISSLDSSDNTVNSGFSSQNTLNPKTPNIFTEVKLTRTNSIVAQSSSLNVSLITSNKYEKNSLIVIRVPSDQMIEPLSTNSIICQSYDESGKLNNILSDCILSKPGADYIEISLKAFCPGSQNYCASKTKMQFRIDNLRNPAELGLSSSSGSVELRTKDGSALIEATRNGLRVLPELDPELITSISMTFSSPEATAINILSTKFTVGSTLPVLGYVSHLFSDPLVIRDQPFPECFYFISGYKTVGDCQLNFLDDEPNSLRQIIYRNPCKLADCQAGTSITVQVQVRNRLTAASHSGSSIIECFSSSSKLLSRGTLIHSTLPALSPLSIGRADFEVLRSTSSLGAAGSIQFKLILPSPLKTGSIIRYSLPIDQIDLVSSSSSVCNRMKPLPSGPTDCKVSLSDNKDYYYIELIQSFCTAYCGAGFEISFSIADALNPSKQRSFDKLKYFSISAAHNSDPIFSSTLLDVIAIPTLSNPAIVIKNITRSAKTLTAPTSLSFSMITSSSLKPDEKIIVKFPDSLITLQSAVGWTLFEDTNDITKYAEIVEAKDKYGLSFIKYLKITGYCLCECVAKTNIMFRISGVYNPAFIANSLSSSLIYLHTATADGYIIDFGAFESSKISVPLEPSPIDQVILKRSKTIPALYTSLNLEFSSSTKFLRNALIKIALPSTQIQPAIDFPALASTDSKLSVTLLNYDKINLPSDSFNVLVKENCPVDSEECLSKPHFNFSFVEMQNPSLNPERTVNNSVAIKVLTNLGDLISSQSSELFISPDIALGSFKDLLITRSVNRAGVEANYTFSFTLTDQLPANATFSIDFPVNISYPPSDSSVYRCTLVTSKKQLIVPCNINLDQGSGSIQSVSFLYACSSDYLKCVSGARVSLKITLKNQKNTKNFANTNYFVFKAKTKIPPKTSDTEYAQGSYSASLLPVLEPGFLTLVSLTGSNNTVYAFPNTITMSIRLTNPITPLSQKGRLKVVIPNQLLTSSPDGCSADLVSTLGRYTLRCSFVSGNELDITHTGVSSLWENQIVELRISNLRNIRDDRQSDSFRLTSWGEFGGEFVIIDENTEEIKYSASVPGFLLVSSVRRSVTIKSKPTELDISIRTTNPIPKDGRIKIEIIRSLQLEFTATGAPSCLIKGTNQIVSCVRNETYLIISNICSASDCPAGKVFEFKIAAGLMNPAFALVSRSPWDSLGIWTQTIDGMYSIDGVNSSVSILPEIALGAIQKLGLSRSNVIVGEETSLSVSITSSSYLNSANSYLIITLPTDIFTGSRFQSMRCSGAQGNSQNCWASFYNDTERSAGQIESNVKEIFVQRFCYEGECPPESALAVTIKGLCNTKFVKNAQLVSNQIKVALAAKDYFGTFREIDVVTDNAGKFFADTRPGTIPSAEFASSYPQFGTESSWYLSFQSQTPLFANSYITLTFPESLQGTFNKTYEKCSTVGLASNPACSKSKNVLTIYDVTQTQVTPSTFVQLNFKSFLNPSEEAITGFSLSIFTKEGYLVDTLGTALSAKFFNDIKKNCPSNCLTCSPFNSSLCLGCNYPSAFPFFNRTTCLTACPDGTFKSASSCLPCHTSCLSCSGPSSQQCVACKAGLKFSSGECLALCPLNSTTGASNCLNLNLGSCPQNCIECGPDPSYCYKCQAGWFWDPVLKLCSNSTNCLAPFYLSKSSKSCQVCDSVCSQCSGTATNCEVCANDFGRGFLDVANNVCVAGCKSNQVLVTEAFSNKCINCHPTCLTCSGPAANQCLSCNKTGDLSFFQYGRCVSGCQEGLEMNKITNRCQMKCNDARCYKCESNSSNCTSCSEPFAYFYNNTCLSFEECPPGTYGTKSVDGQFKCEPCTKPCKTCLGSSTSCTSCITTLNSPEAKDLIAEYLYQDKCLSNCPANWSPDYTDDKTCKNFLCTSPCNLCGGSPKFCYSCVNELPYLYEAYCYVLCPSGSYMIPGGNKTCHRCDSNCLECSYSATACTKCQEGKSLFQNQCLGQCPQDYYMDKVKGTCVEQVMEGYNGPSIFLAACIFAVALYVIVSKCRKRAEMSLVSSFIVIGLPVEFLSKVFIFGNFWGQRQPMGVGIEFMVIMANVVLGMLLGFVHFPLLEKNFKVFRNFTSLNNTFYSLALLGICLFGPFYSDALTCGLLFFARETAFASNPAALSSIHRYKLFSFSLLLAQLGLNIYILLTFKLIRDIFHIAYLNTAFNFVVGMTFLVEAIRNRNRRGYKALVV